MARGGYRPGAGRKKKGKRLGVTAAGRQLGLQGFPELPPVADDSPEGIVIQAAAGGLSPLEYMLSVMADPDADPLRRDRMAVAAAPFLHPRHDLAGKKKVAEEKAQAASSGLYKPAPAPLRRVK